MGFDIVDDRKEAVGRKSPGGLVAADLATLCHCMPVLVFIEIKIAGSHVYATSEEFVWVMTEAGVRFPTRATYH